LATSRSASLRSPALGRWSNLILTIAGNTADDYWGPALLILFVVALILAFGRHGLERARLSAGAAQEAFPEPAISRFFLGSSGASVVWFVVRMNVGAEWLAAGWEKITSPAWGASGTVLTGFVQGALAKSSGPNPAVQAGMHDSCSTSSSGVNFERIPCAVRTGPWISLRSRRQPCERMRRGGRPRRRPR
jgi:hypothetical protein